MQRFRALTSKPIPSKYVSSFLTKANRDTIALWLVQDELSIREIKTVITSIGPLCVYTLLNPFLHEGIPVSKIFLLAAKILFLELVQELPQIPSLDLSHPLSESELSALYRFGANYVVKFHDEEETLIEEAKAYSLVDSSYFLQFYGLYRYNESLVLVMEYFEGYSIEKFVETFGSPRSVDEYGEEIRALPTVIVRKLTKQIFGALLDLQSKKIWHDDFMIGNVLTNGISIRFIDFGGQNQMTIALSRDAKKIALYASCSLESAEWLLTHDPLFIIYNVQTFLAVDFILYMLGLPTYENEGIVSEETISSIEDPILQYIVECNTGEAKGRLTFLECYNLL